MSCKGCTTCTGKCKSEREKLINEAVSKYVKEYDLPDFEASQLRRFAEELSDEELKKCLKG